MEGTRDSVPKLTREGIVRFYRSYYYPNNAILTVIGDITDEELKGKLIPRLEKWPMGEIPKLPFMSKFEKEQKTVKIEPTDHPSQYHSWPCGSEPRES